MHAVPQLPPVHGLAQLSSHAALQEPFETQGVTQQALPQLSRHVVSSHTPPDTHAVAQLPPVQARPQLSRQSTPHAPFDTQAPSQLPPLQAWPQLSRHAALHVGAAVQPVPEPEPAEHSPLVRAET
jgi:hypothetical protein